MRMFGIKTLSRITEICIVNGIRRVKRIFDQSHVHGSDGHTTNDDRKLEE